MTLRIKIFLASFLYALILIAMVQSTDYIITKEYILQKELEDAKAYAFKADRDFVEYLHDHAGTIKSLKNSIIFFANYQPEGKLPQEIEYLFLDLANTHNSIMQIRLLGVDGKERVRIERSGYNDKPKIVLEENLQDKSHRYYFQETMKKSRFEVWYSPIDLNVEHSEIEKPIKPVVRLGVALDMAGKREGVFILNLFMKDFLDEMVRTSQFDVYLIDGDGKVLVDSDCQFCWQRYNLQTTKNSLPFSGELQTILHHDVYESQHLYAKKLSIDNNQDLRLVLVLKDEILAAKQQAFLQKILWIVVFAVVISFILAYWLSGYTNRFHHQLDKLNTRLKMEVSQKDELLSLFEIGDSVLFRWNNDEHWSVKYVSSSVTRLLGYTKGEFERNEVVYANLINKEDIERVIEEVQGAMKNHQRILIHEPYRVRTKSGELKWVLDYTIVIRDERDKIKGFVGYLSDITYMKENERILKELARKDQLTKLYNRLYLDEMLTNQYFRFLRNGEQCCLVMLDIDHFKTINDTYGHLVGDEILKEVGELIQNSIRSHDLIGRWGGEEFLIILPHTEIKSASLLAHKLLDVVSQHQFAHELHITISLGVAQLRRGMSIEDWIGHVDTALYDAKDAGRNRVKLYHS